MALLTPEPRLESPALRGIVFMHEAGEPNAQGKTHKNDRAITKREIHMLAVLCAPLHNCHPQKHGDRSHIKTNHLY